MFGLGAEPPQQLKEYDPEWGRAFCSGTVYGGCDHFRMLGAVKVPVLFTHHFRIVDETSGMLLGAISDQQVAAVGDLISKAGNDFRLVSFPEMGHSMHGQDPAQYTETLTAWATDLGLRERAPTNRIDVHAHFLPDAYRAAASAAGHAQPDGMPALPEWSASEHVAVLDRQGIATACCRSRHRACTTATTPQRATWRGP